MVRRDRDGTKFAFAPLGGEYFASTVTDAEQAGLPDSMLVRGANGVLLQKSAAALYVLRRLGGVWWIPGALGWLVPKPLRDLGYGAVAAVRHRLFKKPSDTCPQMPPELRSRFRR